MKELKPSQRKYLETLLENPNFNSPTMRLILKNGSYSLDDGMWLNDFKESHSLGTIYEIK